MRVPKYECHNLASPLLSFWSLWTAFTSCCSLSWRTSCFRCVVVDPCFIHCHIPTQKILFTSFDQLQTALWILEALLFMVGCEKTRHPLQKQLTHPQRFVQNCKHTTRREITNAAYFGQISVSTSTQSSGDIMKFKWKKLVIFMLHTYGIVHALDTLRSHANYVSFKI